MTVVWFNIYIPVTIDIHIDEILCPIPFNIADDECNPAIKKGRSRIQLLPFDMFDTVQAESGSTDRSSSDIDDYHRYPIAKKGLPHQAKATSSKARSQHSSTFTPTASQHSSTFTPTASQHSSTSTPTASQHSATCTPTTSQHSATCTPTAQQMTSPKCKDGKLSQTLIKLH